MMKETGRSGSYRGEPYGRCLDISVDPDHFKVRARLFGVLPVQLISISPAALLSVSTERSVFLLFLRAMVIRLQETPDAAVATLRFRSRRMDDWLRAFAALGVPIHDRR